MNENPYGSNPQNGSPYQQQNNYPNQMQQPGGYPPYQQQNNYPNQPQQPGGYPPYQQQNPYQMPVNTAPMPNAGLYLALVIIGFVLGIIWGALSVGPYKKMKEAIAANNADEANANAKKIRTFFFIGLAVNVVLFIGRIAQGM